MKCELVIVGFGNTLRGDDGFGAAVVDRLLERELPLGVSVLARATLTPDLAETLAQSRSVIFIDANAELEPGRVDFRQITVEPSADVSLVHSLSPEALLNWTRELYGRTPDAELWLAGVEATDLAEELTDTLRRRVPEFVAALELRIEAARPKQPT
jgi:hydrogenase maturation protease